MLFWAEIRETSEILGSVFCFLESWIFTNCLKKNGLLFHLGLVRRRDSFPSLAKSSLKHVFSWIRCIFLFNLPPWINIRWLGPFLGSRVYNGNWLPASQVWPSNVFYSALQLKQLFEVILPMLKTRRFHIEFIISWTKKLEYMAAPGSYAHQDGLISSWSFGFCHVSLVYHSP